MSAKRRKIVAEDLDRGYGATTIPTDSGGTRAAAKFGIHSLMGSAYLFASDQSGSTPDAQVSNGLTALSALGGGTIYVSADGGAQTWTSTVTVPSKCHIVLGPGTYTSAAATAAIAITPTSYYTGSVKGNGTQTIINYTGSGSAIKVNGTGETVSSWSIEDLVIAGSSAGVAGVHLKALNGGLIKNVQSSGFTSSTGSGFLIEGANALTMIGNTARDNKYGIHMVGVVVGGSNYAANANAIFGGQIVANSSYGVWEDGALSATVGANIGNSYNGVTFQDNGTNGSASLCNFFLQQGYGCKITNCYFEYASKTPTNNIIIGDATYTPQGNEICFNVFLSTSATNTILGTRSQTTLIMGNQENATITNFYNHSANMSLARVLFNSALGATNQMTGTDSNVDLLFFPGSAALGLLNGFATTTRGLGFQTIAGLSASVGLAIRNNNTATNTVTFQQADGTTAAAVLNDGTLQTITAQIKAGGNLNFYVSRGQHVHTFAANNDLCGASTLSGGTKAIVFTTAFASAPIVVACSATANPVYVSATSTTGFTVTGTASDAFYYIIMGNPN